MCFSISCLFSYNCIKLIVFWVDILVYFHRIFVFFSWWYLLCKDWFNLPENIRFGEQIIFNQGSGWTFHKFRIAAWLHATGSCQPFQRKMSFESSSSSSYIVYIFSPNPICRVSSNHFACCITVAMPVEFSASISLHLIRVSRFANILKGQINRVCKFVCIAE